VYGIMAVGDGVLEVIPQLEKFIARTNIVDEVRSQYIPGNFVLFAFVTPYALGDDLLPGNQVKPFQRICGVR
jgi:hypothetical protein